jgi:GDPmannose 4,6-dehydratase
LYKTLAFCVILLHIYVCQFWASAKANFMGHKVAFITGITGQDGALLAQFLLGKGYTVHGMRPYAATEDCERLQDGVIAHPDFHLHYGDLTDGASLIRLLQASEPDEVYNLGAQSHVAVSFQVPEQTANVNALGTLRILESLAALGMQKKTRFYQASSSEMFGNTPSPQNEMTPFQPCSPYAVAKLYAYWMTRLYRDAHGFFACNGILFNHESPLRGEGFVTRKIARAVASGNVLTLGNLDSRRDWGHAKDYVRGMWMMLQQDKADDFVLATGQAHSVRDFVTRAYVHTGVSIRWQGQGLKETGCCASTGKTLVTVDPALFRPVDINCLIGDVTKARKHMGWSAEISFDQLVAEMVTAECGRKDEDLAAE